MHLKSTLGLLLASILLFSCSYDSLDPSFVEQWFAAQNAPFVEVEFKEEQYIKPAGELPEEHIGADARPPLIAWPEPPRKIDSLIKQYYTVMLNMDNMQPIWIAKSNRNKRNTAFASNIIEYQTPGPGNYLITVLPVSSDFNTSILDNFQSFMNNVMELALTDLEELAQTVRRAGILGMGIAECSISSPHGLSPPNDGPSPPNGDSGPLIINYLLNGDAFTNKYIENGKPSISWNGGAAASKFYALMKDEDGKVNWLASFPGTSRDTNTVEQEFVPLNIYSGKIIGTTNHTISLYSVSSDFTNSSDKDEVQNALESNTNVLESTSKRVYTGFKVWSDGIIDGIMDSRHIKDGDDENDGDTRPLIEWQFTGDSSNVQQYIIWITEENYTQPRIDPVFDLLNMARFASNPPIWLARTSSYNNDSANASKVYLPKDYQRLNRGTADTKYYITVFTYARSVASLLALPPVFLSNITDPSSVTASSLPDEVTAWSTTEFIVPAEAPFMISSPTGILSDEHIGSEGIAPFVAWQSPPVDSNRYYLAMSNSSTDELSWLVELSDLDTNSISNTIFDYRPPVRTSTEQSYVIEVYSVSSSFVASNDASTLHNTLRSSEPSVLGNASTTVTIQESLSTFNNVVITSKAFTITSTSIIDGILSDEHIGSGSPPPLVEWTWEPWADSSEVSEYYISLTSEDFNPSGLSMPDWFAKTGSSARSSIEAEIVKISVMDGSYDAPSAGDNKEYSLSVMAVKRGFNPTSLRGVDTASVVPGSELPISMTSNGVISIDTIKFHIPD